MEIIDICLKFINDYSSYFIAGICIILIIMLILQIVNGVKIHNIKKKLRAFTSGQDGRSMEDAILDKFEEIDRLDNVTDEINSRLEKIDGRLVNAYQKMGIVRYDAFQEIGGKLSFCIALLTDQNDGFILNTMHSTTEGCYTYIKKVENGKVENELSEEEAAALKSAISNENVVRTVDPENDK